MARDEKRRDTGEFYPGGKVWVKPGQSQPQVHVTWEQIEGKPQIAPLPDKYRDSDVKGKINEIASKFATVVVAALIGWTAFADITVQKKRKDQIYNDEQVVVDVTGSGVGVDTNAVRDIVREQLATNGIRSVDGAARPLPKYLHLYNADDSYPDEAQEYYRSRGNGKTDGGCSSVRDGGFLYRNFDYPFDDRAEFVVKMSAGKGRFASVGVAQVGTNLTEQMVTSGKWSKWYKALPGATVDGINENGVACNINVVDGDPQTSGWYRTTIPDPIHPLAAIRWILDHATNAQQAATYIASHIRFPNGWTQNFHYMIADETATYIVENGSAFPWEQYLPAVNPVLTNYQLLGGEPVTGEGRERANLLEGYANITNVWYTNAYRRETTPPWVSDLKDVLAYTNDIFNAWASHPKEYFRGKTNNGEPWWQSVHTSVYDLTNRVLRVAVQEVDDWYTFLVPSSGAKVDAYTKAETDAKLDEKRDKTDLSVYDFKFRFDFGDSGLVECNEPEWNEEGYWYAAALDGDENDYGCYAWGDKERDSYSFDVIGVGPSGGKTFTGFRDVKYKTSDNIAKESQLAEKHPLNGELDILNGLAFYGASGVRFATDDGRYFFDSSGDAEFHDVYVVGPEGISVARLQFGSYADSEALERSNWNFIRAGSSDDGWHYLWDDVTNEVRKAKYTPSATDTTFSNAVMGVASHTNAAFAAEVLAVQVASLSTNIMAEVYIAATNACANLGIDPALIPQGGTLGTVGGLLVALAAAVALLGNKTKLLKSDGTADDTFATDLMQKQVAKDAIAYKVATDAGENRSVLVVEIAETATAAVNVVVPAPVANKVIDFEVWVKVAARSTDIPQINYGYMVDDTFTPVTLIKKGGENPAYEKDASATVTNIVHFTSSDASGYTVVAAAFK